MLQAGKVSRKRGGFCEVEGVVLAVLRFTSYHRKMIIKATLHPTLAVKMDE